MRVLLDENLPHDLTEILVGLEVMTVQSLGWAGVRNGELLRRASGRVDAFVTMDRNLRHQQNLAALPFGVVLIVARSSRIQDLLPLTGAVVAALTKIRPGQLEQVGVKIFGRSATRVAGIGAGAGAVISTWNLIGMYTTIPVATWDVGRQVLFLAALAVVAGVAARAARAGGSWGLTGGLSTVAAVSCAATVLGIYAVSTMLGTNRIRQVPEFIRDYTNNGYTSPATYFADHYWALLALQAFTWVIGAVGLAAVGTVLGRAHSRRQHP